MPHPEMPQGSTITSGDPNVMPTESGLGASSLGGNTLTSGQQAAGKSDPLSKFGSEMGSTTTGASGIHDTPMPITTGSTVSPRLTGADVGSAPISASSISQPTVVLPSAGAGGGLHAEHTSGRGKQPSLLESTPNPSSLYPFSLNTVQDFKIAGMEIEKIGEALALQASECKMKAKLIKDRAKEDKSKELTKEAKMNEEFYDEIKNVGKKIADEGRSIHLFRLADEVIADQAMHPTSAAQGLAANATSAASGMMATGTQSHVATVEFTPVFKPRCLTSPISGEEDIMLAGRELENIGMFLSSEAIKDKTAAKLQKDKAKEMHAPKTEIAVVKKEIRAVKEFEKHGRRIAELGRVMQNLRLA